MKLVPLKKKSVFVGGEENQSELWVKLGGGTQGVLHNCPDFLDAIASLEIPYILQVTS